MRTIIFDLFETLITEWGAYKYTTALMAEDMGLQYHLIASEWGEMEHRMDLGEITLYNAMVHIATVFGSAVTEQQIIEMVNKRLKTRGDRILELDSQIENLLTNLKANGYCIGLISNCSHEDMITIQESKLKSYIDFCILSCSENITKPDKRIYLKWCEKMDVSPNDCIYIGDGGSNELVGADECGMTALQAGWFIKEYRMPYANTNGYPCLNSQNELLKYLDMV